MILSRACPGPPVRDHGSSKSPSALKKGSTRVCAPCMFGFFLLLFIRRQADRQISDTWFRQTDRQTRSGNILRRKQNRTGQASIHPSIHSSIHPSIQPQDAKMVVSPNSHRRSNQPFLAHIHHLPSHTLPASSSPFIVSQILPDDVTCDMYVIQNPI